LEKSIFRRYLNIEKGEKVAKNGRGSKSRHIIYINCFFVDALPSLISTLSSWEDGEITRLSAVINSANKEKALRLTTSVSGQRLPFERFTRIMTTTTA